MSKTATKQKRDKVDMAQSLRIIRTWAAYDENTGKNWALRPADVVRLCDRALP